MKNFKSKIYFLLLAGIGMLACEKEEDRVIFSGGNDPVLTASSTTNLVLTKAQENYTSLQFHWTNPEYSFSNGVNTQDVHYTLEIDTVGSNFTNPKQAAITFTNNLNTTFLVKDLNNALAVLELKDFVAHNFEFRIKATLASGSVPVYSNKVAITITTYLDVVYPVPANLYIVGDATPSGWANDQTNPNASQTFTKVKPYLFEISSLSLSNAHFLFLPVKGDWSHKYAFGTSSGEKDKNGLLGDKFTYDGKNDFLAPEAGNYKITVNFKTGKYSLVKL